MGPDAMNDADINFYFDPLCPFALDDEQMGPAGRCAARLHRGLAVHLAAQ